MKTIRLTMAQALAGALAAQETEIDGRREKLFGGVWAIFGHGNVAGLGEALYQVRDALPTFRGHNEQAMALAAIAYAKALRRRRMMACTSSIGPGATNMVTAAAVAHVNRLPVLLLPGDVFASRRPDPVLQQVESFADGTVSANDCFRPVSRYFDRLTRPEQLIGALERAFTVLTDPAECGPVTLALCQDTQAEAYDYPVSMFAKRVWMPRRVRADARELAEAVAVLRRARRPLIVAGGGVLYSGRRGLLQSFAAAHGIPVAETQAGKSSLLDTHEMNMGAIGVTGTAAANALAREADVILAVGTRLTDFATGSRALFAGDGRRIVGLNVQAMDAGKHRALPLVSDAQEGLAELGAALAGWRAPEAWTARASAEKQAWTQEAAGYTAPTDAALPSDAQVLGAVQRAVKPGDIIVCAAGGLPGELHKLWRATEPGSYHLEYGFSCMGYEIAGGLGVKLARPECEVFVLVGDGSYLMMNSELATSVMLGCKLTVVVLDNGGFGCINRLQQGTGGAAFNNLFRDAQHAVLPAIDFVAHARSLGATAEKVTGITGLQAALARARESASSTVIVIDTDAAQSTDAGGSWWDVAVPEVSPRVEVREAHAGYVQARARQLLD